MDDGWWIGVVGSVAMRCCGDGRSRCCERIADDFDEERERGGQREGGKMGFAPRSEKGKHSNSASELDMTKCP
jgi:hypothetical protein